MAPFSTRQQIYLYISRVKHTCTSHVSNIPVHLTCQIYLYISRVKYML